MEDDSEGFIPDNVPSKFCRKCQQFRPKTEFYKRGGKSVYLSAYCKTCHLDTVKYDNIRCPHCSEKISFFGLTTAGKVKRDKHTKVLNRLYAEAKRDFKEGKVPKRKRVTKEHFTKIEDDDHETHVKLAIKKREG